MWRHDMPSNFRSFRSWSRLMPYSVAGPGRKPFISRTTAPSTGSTVSDGYSRHANRTRVSQAQAGAAGLQNDARIHHGVPVPAGADSAIGGIHSQPGARMGPFLGDRDGPPGRCLTAPELWRFVDRRLDQCLVWTPGRLGAGALHVPVQAAHRRHRGFALRAADRGGRHRVDLPVRTERLAGRCAEAAGDQSGLHTAGNRGGTDLHRPAVRGSNLAAGRSSRPRRPSAPRRRKPLYGSFCRRSGRPCSPASRSPLRARSANTVR